MNNFEEIFKLKKAVEANHAFTSAPRFVNCVKLERYTTAALEMLVGKARDMGIENQVYAINNMHPDRFEVLYSAYKDLMKTKRYQVKSKLIDNYIRLN